MRVVSGLVRLVNFRLVFSVRTCDRDMPRRCPGSGSRGTAYDHDIPGGDVLRTRRSLDRSASVFAAEAGDFSEFGSVYRGDFDSWMALALGRGLL